MRLWLAGSLGSGFDLDWPKRRHGNADDYAHEARADRQATVAATIGVAATAHADLDSFQSPSGSIVCSMGTIISGNNYVDCEIADHTWVAPPRSPDCHLNWGSRFTLEQGSAAVFACSHQELPAPDQILDYGQTRSVGAITCNSESSSMTRTNSSTGHFFRVSQDSYQLG